MEKPRRGTCCPQGHKRRSTKVFEKLYQPIIGTRALINIIRSPGLNRLKFIALLAAPHLTLHPLYAHCSPIEFRHYLSRPGQAYHMIMANIYELARCICYS